MRVTRVILLWKVEGFGLSLPRQLEVGLVGGIEKGIGSALGGSRRRNGRAMGDNRLEIPLIFDLWEVESRQGSKFLMMESGSNRVTIRGSLALVIVSQTHH